MRGFNFGMISRAYPDSVAARGKSSIVRHTPSARKNDRVRQVSWLPDQHARPAFPDGIKWHRREHSPVTVAGAAPVYGLGSEERRGGEECGGTCRSRGSQNHEKKKKSK